MPRLLAIEWDQLEARYVIASHARSKLTIEQAGAIELPQASEELPVVSAERIGAAIRDGMRGSRSNATVLLGVSRADIELSQLGLPPSRDEDLPDLVRHQAARELGSMTEATLLDFLPLPSQPGEARAVLAAALSPEHYEQMQAVAESAGLKPHRMLIRPHAAGSLLQKQLQPSERVSLLVSCLGNEADLAVLVDGRVLLCRSVRLSPANGSDPADGPLLAEIRRTIFAVQNQPGGGPVSAVYVCGDPQRDRDLVTRIQDELSLAAEVFQPFQGLKLSRELDGQLPEHPGRYVALLGMLAEEVEGKHTIDFLHPRKKREPVSKTRMAALAAAVLALIVGGASYLAYEKFAEVDGVIAELTKKNKALDTNMQRSAQKEAAVAAIEEWQLGDVVWLDELRDLSLRFPKPRDAVVLRMTLASKSTGGGAIELEGLVRDPSIVSQMESNLRDDYHEVRTKRVQESVQGANHTWKFDSSLVVGLRDKTKYQSHLPPSSSTAQRASDPRYASRVEDGENVAAPEQEP